MSPVTIRLDAQFGTPYPRSAGFDTDNGLGNEAEEDAAELNYDYEWVVYDQCMSNLVYPFFLPFFPS